jgi:hypothetical protein
VTRRAFDVSGHIQSTSMMQLVQQRIWTKKGHDVPNSQNTIGKQEVFPDKIKEQQVKLHQWNGNL